MHFISETHAQKKYPLHSHKQRCLQVYFIQYVKCKQIIKKEDPMHKCREGKTNYSQCLVKVTAVTMEVDSRSQMNEQYMSKHYHKHLTSYQFLIEKTY